MMKFSATMMLYMSSVNGFSLNNSKPNNEKLSVTPVITDRRTLFKQAAGITFASAFVVAQKVNAEAGADTMEDKLDVDSFLRTGMVQNPMGVSGQAGKSKPETGIVLRDGVDVLRDPRSGGVSAEVLVNNNTKAIFASFVSPWPIATGPVFDIECRDAKNGDGAFMAVTGSTNGKGLAELPNDFFLKRLFSPTGRYSFYGPPTDVKVKKSYMNGDYRFIELQFSNLSQSTQAEIPRYAVISATIPPGSENAVMLVGGATATRWRKGSEATVRAAVESFRAIEAPKSSGKIRPKKRDSEL